METNESPSVEPFDPVLLLRPHPGRKEGPLGYRLRLAEANYLSSWDIGQLGFRYELSWLLEQGLIPPSEVDPDLHAHVARMSGFLKSASRIWNQRHPRFCPLCLAEEPEWRAAWEILFFDACPRHGVWLMDQCSSCGEPVRWKRDQLVRCQCGSDLRLESPGSAPGSVRQLSSILEAKLLGCELVGQLPPVAGLDVEQLQRLIRYLGGYMDPVPGRRPLKLRNAGCLQASWPVTSLAAEILLQWPQSFHDGWSRLQSSTDGEKARLGSVFRHAYDYLYRGFWESAFLPVREAFEQWLAEHWKGGLCKRNRRLPSELLAKVHWIPGKVAADQLGISLQRLRSLLAEGLVEGQESITTTGRRFLMVRRDQLEQIDLQLANELTMTEAMAMLGICKVRMQRLLRLLFPGARRINNKESMPWCVPRNEVEVLLEITDRLLVVAIPEEDQVSLAHVFKYWTWTAEEIVALIEAVRDGSVAPNSALDTARGIGRWVFNAKELRAWQASLYRGGKQWLSIPEAAKVLGIKQQVAYWLTQNGHLPVSEKLGTTNKDSSRVHRKDIRSFRDQHIYAKEIADRLNTSSRKVARLLAEEGIYPLRGHSKHPSRKLIYRHNEEVRRFLLMVTGKSVSELPALANRDERIIRSDGISGPPQSNSDPQLTDSESP